jgi:hypothetical protein
MALRPEERAWLTGVQADMMTAAGKAEVYAGAMRMYLDDFPTWRWWRVARRIGRRRAYRRAERLYWLYDEEVSRCEALISGWLNVHEVTAGQSRGPIMTPLHPQG